MASSPRPTPIFADRILQQDVAAERESEKLAGKKAWQAIKQKVRSAQKFVLTIEAVNRIIEAMELFPEQLTLNAKFARPPHDLTWIEVADDSGGREYNTSYLIENGRMYTIVSGVKFGRTDTFMPMPITIDLNVEPTREEFQETIAKTGFSIEELDRAIWGRLYDSVPDHIRARTRTQHRINFDLSEEGMQAWRNNDGDIDVHLRMVLATLLAFNQPKSVLNITTKDAQRRMTAKGPTRYFAHNVVTIDLGSKNRIRFDYRGPGGEHASPRWHEVMGHFVTNRTARTANCTHGFGLPNDWWVAIESDDGKQRWECLGCGGKRTWRTYPEGRGDGSRGMSLHHHVVQG